MGNEMGNNNSSGLQEDENKVAEIRENVIEEVVDGDGLLNSVILAAQERDFNEKETKLLSDCDSNGLDDPRVDDVASKAQDRDFNEKETELSSGCDSNGLDDPRVDDVASKEYVQADGLTNDVFLAPQVNYRKIVSEDSINGVDLQDDDMNSNEIEEGGKTYEINEESKQKDILHSDASQNDVIPKAHCDNTHENTNEEVKTGLPHDIDVQDKLTSNDREKERIDVYPRDESKKLEVEEARYDANESSDINPDCFSNEESSLKEVAWESSLKEVAWESSNQDELVISGAIVEQTESAFEENVGFGQDDQEKHNVTSFASLNNIEDSFLADISTQLDKNSKDEETKVREDNLLTDILEQHGKNLKDEKITVLKVGFEGDNVVVPCNNSEDEMEEVAKNGPKDDLECGTTRNISKVDEGNDVEHDHLVDMNIENDEKFLHSSENEEGKDLEDGDAIFSVLNSYNESKPDQEIAKEEEEGKTYETNEQSKQKDVHDIDVIPEAKCDKTHTNTNEEVKTGLPHGIDLEDKTSKDREKEGPDVYPQDESTKVEVEGALNESSDIKPDCFPNEEKHMESTLEEVAWESSNQDEECSGAIVRKISEDGLDKVEEPCKNLEDEMEEVSKYGPKDDLECGTTHNISKVDELNDHLVDTPIENDEESIHKLSNSVKQTTFPNNGLETDVFWHCLEVTREEANKFNDDYKAGESVGRFSNEANPENMNVQPQMEKSPSFGLDLRIKARTETEEPDQTTLLYQDKVANIDQNMLSQKDERLVGTETCTNEHAVQEKVAALETSDSEKSKTSFFGFLKEDDDARTVVTPEKVVEDLSNVYTTKVARKSKGKRKVRSSLFGACMGCATVIN